MTGEKANFTTALFCTRHVNRTKGGFILRDTGDTALPVSVIWIAWLKTCSRTGSLVWSVTSAPTCVNESNEPFVKVSAPAVVLPQKWPWPPTNPCMVWWLSISDSGTWMVQETSWLIWNPSRAGSSSPAFPHFGVWGLRVIGGVLEAEQPLMVQLAEGIPPLHLNAWHKALLTSTSSGLCLAPCSPPVFITEMSPVLSSVSTTPLNFMVWYTSFLCLSVRTQAAADTFF